jgi:endoribonuclease Dicer
MRNALLAVDSKKQETYDMKTKPKLWSVGDIPDQLYLTVLKLETPEALDRPYQPLALLTRSPLPQLPSFFLHFGSGRHSQVQNTPFSLALEATSHVVQLINTFTLCIFDDVFSKGYQSDPAKMPYFLAPVAADAEVGVSADPASAIAWDVLQSIHDYQEKWAENPWDNQSWQTKPDEFFNDRYIVDPFDGSRKLWTVGVTQQYKPLDPVPPNTAPRKGARKNNDNIMEYSCSLWAKARSRRTFDTEQRVIEAKFISLRRNLLDDFDEPEEETPKKCFIILEPLKISPVSIRTFGFELTLTMA